ncbi:glutathione-specific gamma-glutamylcyclotransferase 2-like, partial [Actinia tenebrosa]|uniref:glutathione-specific gamma-glutamylcyclotransferase n=1 Tax=Actinia tenebrosa TaxID=6105 RepID=A0A6P8GZ52_ACTTE
FNIGDIIVISILIISYDCFQPGRVATLLDDKEGVVWGVAYEVEPAEIENVLMYLDIREKDGYKSTYTTLHTIDHSAPTIKVMLYIATPSNNFYLGPAPLPDIAKQIAYSEGPSGKNSEYLLKLSAFMHEVRKQHEDCKDEHLFELEVLVKNNLEGLGNTNI